MTDSRSHIDDLARNEGLIFLGSAPLNTLTDFARFAEWLEQGNHGEMAFLERNQQFREHPEGLLPGAKSALVFALNYYLGDRSIFQFATKEPRVAQYARMRDYHKVLKHRCTRIAEKLHSKPEPESDGANAGAGAGAGAGACESEGEGDATPKFRVLVDSAPILERAIARQTGQGFIGKNTCFISPKSGSFLLLAEVLSTLPVPSQPKSLVDPTVRSADGGCGTCQRCQVHCPTGALDVAWNLDARKCLSYWTIEHRGVIPEEFWPWLATYWFGCDICQLVCPWNRKATVSTEMELRRIPENLDLAQVAMMDQNFYEAQFGGSPMTRAKREGLRRNALIAMAVTGHKSLTIALEAAAADDNSMLQETAHRVRQWLQSRIDNQTPGRQILPS